MTLAKPIRDFFTRNLGYKAVALVLAILLWYDVTSDETTVIDYPVPLQIAVEGADMIITNQEQLPPEVEVAFSGTGRELMRLDKNDLAVQEAVEGGENDSIVVTLDLSDVRKPTDLAVTAMGITPCRSNHRRCKNMKSAFAGSTNTSWPCTVVANARETPGSSATATHR